VSQFVRGLRYIDEVVMVRVKDEGELYVHQDANWNVVGLTDLGGRLVERYVYRPYGEVIVHQLGGYADYDGDGDVDANDRGEITGLTCGGSNPSGACRVLDLDFDNDCDSSDETVFDALPHTGTVIHPARRSSLLGQPFAHQGLLLEPEIASYHNRARQYSPGLRRFVQRDPLVTTQRSGRGYLHGMSPYGYVRARPLTARDATGLDPNLCNSPADMGVCCYGLSDWGAEEAPAAKVYCCNHGTYCLPVGCVNPFINQMHPDPLVRHCILAHEIQHCRDITCRFAEEEQCQGCGIVSDYTEEQLECRANLATLACLLRYHERGNDDQDEECNRSACFIETLCVRGFPLDIAKGVCKEEDEHGWPDRGGCANPWKRP
jgi:RHS repeat-associated protein